MWIWITHFNLYIIIAKSVICRRASSTLAPMPSGSNSRLHLIMVVASSPSGGAEIRILLIRSWCHDGDLSGVRVVFSQIEAIRVKSHLDGVWSSEF